MKNKWLLWSLCIAVYLMQLPSVVSVLVQMSNPDGASGEIHVALQMASSTFGFFAVLLCFANLVAAVRGGVKELPAPYQTTAAVKIALIPFYILRFLSVAVLMIFNSPDSTAFGIGLVFLVGLLAVSYIFMLLTGVYNIVYLLKRAIKEKKPLCLLWIIPHFIYFADVVASILLWRREKCAAATEEESMPAGAD